MRAGNWEIAVLLRDNQHEIAKMTDQLGQTFFCQGKQKPKETNTSEGMHPPLDVQENKY